MKLYTEKVCKTCSKKKPMEDFPNHPQTLDGKGGSCKACMKDKKAALDAKRAKYKFF